MSSIPMDRRPAPLKDTASHLGDPRDKLAGMYDQMQRRLSRAKAAGDHKEAQRLRTLLEQTKKILDEYGPDRTVQHGDATQNL